MDLLTCGEKYRRYFVNKMVKEMFVSGVSEEEVILRNTKTYLDITELGDKNVLVVVLETCKQISENGGLHNRQDSGCPMDYLFHIIYELATLKHKKILYRMFKLREFKKPENSGYKQRLQKIVDRLDEEPFFR